MTQLNVRVPDSWIERINELARRTRMSQAQFIRQAIVGYAFELPDVIQSWSDDLRENIELCEGRWEND